jgi:HPt (histidine-containing phosphotransfer) domain-containing protein
MPRIAENQMINSKRYEYVNLAYIEELADGEENFLSQIIGMYLTFVPPHLTMLETAVNTKDYSKVTFYAHKLKGSFSFIGCTQLSDPFTLIEDYCQRNTNLEKVPQLLAQITILLNNITAELEEIMSYAKSA